MTLTEFDKTKWTGGMKITYEWRFEGVTKIEGHSVCSVDFIERLIAFKIENDECLKWVRCENCKLI